VLISAVAFDLVEEAISKSGGHGAAIAGLFAGCAVFFGGDWLIDHFGGADRKDADGGQANGSALAIVLGTVLDGVPESMVIGLTIFQGGAVGAAYLTAVSSPTCPNRSPPPPACHRRLEEVADPVDVDRDRVISGLASLAGYGLFQHSSPGTVAFVLAFAAGAILTMLADTMMPEAHQHGGKLTGVVTTLGFAIAATIHLLD
jgi:Predicted divalent heavy-metal cations transporter